MSVVPPKMRVYIIQTHLSSMVRRLMLGVQGWSFRSYNGKENGNYYNGVILMENMEITMVFLADHQKIAFLYVKALGEEIADPLDMREEKFDAWLQTLQLQVFRAAGDSRCSSHMLSGLWRSVLGGSGS